MSHPLKRRRTSNKQPAKRYTFDDDWEEKEYGNTTQESRKEAVEAFLNLLLREYALSSMFATTLCTLCHFVVLMGVESEKLHSFALAPGQCTGNYQKRLDEALETKKTSRVPYDLEVPMYDMKSARRVTKKIEVKPVWEVLEEEAEDSNVAWEVLEKGNDLGEHTDNYTKNPIVQACSPEIRTQIWQLALYLDGVAFSKRLTASLSITPALCPHLSPAHTYTCICTLIGIVYSLRGLPSTLAEGFPVQDILA